VELTFLTTEAATTKIKLPTPQPKKIKMTNVVAFFVVGSEKEKD